MRVGGMAPRALAIVFCLSDLVGCTSAAVQTPTLTMGPEKTYDEIYTPSQARHSLGEQYYLHPLPTDMTQYRDLCPKFSTDAQKCYLNKSYRDFIQNDLLKRSDQICTAYQTRLIHAFTVGGAGVKVAQNILQVLLSPAALADTVLQTATGNIFSTTSTEILQYDKFMTVNRQIYRLREAKRAEILKKQDDKTSIENYSVSRAIYDAEIYHGLCNYAVQLAAGAPDPKPAAEAKK